MPSERLDVLAEKIVTVPETFNLHRKLKRFVKELGEMARGEAPLSWAAAEHLAYASLLTEGHSVRISGQDAIRGTFTHRHVGWTDNDSNVRYFALQNLDPNQGRFDCYNSPLSEFGVLGFEFGYSLASPDTLLIWEAQFGDFANGHRSSSTSSSAARRTSGTGSAVWSCSCLMATRDRGPSTAAHVSSDSCSCVPKTTCRSAT